MTKLALPAVVLPAVLAACVDPVYPEREVPTTPVEIEVTTRAGEGPLVIATGGTVELAIDDPTSVGLEGTASDGYRVEPAGLVWPNTRAPRYDVRALAPGMGSFEIATNHGIATGLVESADLATVALVPADYVLDGSSPFAIDVARRDVAIELRAADGRRLVDASLGIAVEQTGWDRATLPATVARHLVLVYGDSLGERTVAVDVVDGAAVIQRVEGRVSGGRVCFHAYAGTTEIATAMTITGGEPVPGAANCADGDPQVIAARVP